MPMPMALLMLVTVVRATAKAVALLDINLTPCYCYHTFLCVHGKFNVVSLMVPLSIEAIIISIAVVLMSPRHITRILHLQRTLGCRLLGLWVCRLLLVGLCGALFGYWTSAKTAPC